VALLRSCTALLGCTWWCWGRYNRRHSRCYFLLNSTVNDFENRILRDHAASVASYLAFDKGRWFLTLPPDLRAIYAKSYSGYALAVVGRDGRVIYSSLPNNIPFSKTEPNSAQSVFFGRIGALPSITV